LGICHSKNLENRSTFAEINDQKSSVYMACYESVTYQSPPQTTALSFYTVNNVQHSSHYCLMFPSQ